MLPIFIIIAHCVTVDLSLFRGEVVFEIIFYFCTIKSTLSKLVGDAFVLNGAAVKNINF